MWQTLFCHRWPRSRAGSPGGGNNGGGGSTGGGPSGGSGDASVGASGAGASTSGGFVVDSHYVPATSPKRDDAACEKTEAALKACYSSLLWTGTKQDGSFWFGGYEFEYPTFTRCMKTFGYKFQQDFDDRTYFEAHPNRVVEPQS